MSDVKVGLKKCAILCILRNKDKILLLQRAKQPHYMKYIPIGGKLEPFETPVEAAKREVKEECGVDLANLKFCGVMVETSPVDFNWVNFIYTAEVDFFEPPPCNEGTLKWVKISDLSNISTPTTDRYIYHYVLKGKPFMFNAIYNEKIELLELHEEIENKTLYKKL